MHTTRRRVHAIFGHALTRGGVAYTLTEIMDHLGPNIEVFLHAPQMLGIESRSYHRPAFGKLAYKIFSFAERKLKWSEIELSTFDAALEYVQHGDIVYMWPPYSEELILRAQDKGAIVVAERINCMGEMCKARLTMAYARTGQRLPEGWCTPEAIADEQRQMRTCDFVTAPNVFVRESLLSAGISPYKILDTCYGYSPSRLARASLPRERFEPPTYLFVGLGNVRKGLDVLLEAWEYAQVDGRLLIAGEIDAGVKQRYARQLAMPNVKALGYVQDIDLVYAQSDVFVFPSHEEGGPQVIYEAAGAGLACITSPMGAGRLLPESFMCVNPISSLSVARALIEVADDRELRRNLGANAQHEARTRFTWGHVGSVITRHFSNLDIRSTATVSSVAIA